MVQPGVDGLDTPRTNVGDATYLSRRPDFDISQELSFQSPSKDANVLQQMRNGGRPNLRTPRGSRAPFTDRQNLPASIGGGEFTPLLKSATRNSTRQRGIGGKENGLATPGFLAKIDEDMTPMPVGESSIYGASRNTSSYLEHTPLPEAEDTSSIASTPMVMRRRGDGNGPLQDGNHHSLREQEAIIDNVQKENFSLKLKIHFLEEALQRAGPDFNQATLQENTELKVDKVQMQKDLQRYKKVLTSAEKDLESYRQQILDLQEKTKRKFADEGQRKELERLRQLLEQKDSDIEDLQRQLAEDQDQHDKIGKLQDEVGDLEAELREKDRIIEQQEDQLEDVKEKCAGAEEELEDMKRQMADLEKQAEASKGLQEAKETIQDLEADVRRLEAQLDGMKGKLQDAVTEKERAETDLEELQEEMANKSVMTKGLSRQVEEKIARLQTELEKSRNQCSSLEERTILQQKEIDTVRAKLKEACKERDSSEQIRQTLESKLAETQREIHSLADEKALLQTRHDALTNESGTLQREVSALKKSMAESEESLEEEKRHSLNIERDIRAQYKDEIDRLNDEISDLQAECREKDNLYDNDSEKWETERQNLESERDHAEERAAGLQRTIDKLRDAEGSLTDKETRLQQALQSETERHNSEQAVLSRQIEDLQQNLDSRQAMLEDLRNELSAVRDLLRQSELDNQAQAEKVESLEDEVEVLQATIDEESERARLEQERLQKECDRVKQQITLLQSTADSARASKAASQESAQQSSENLARLRFQLADANDSLARVTKDRQSLQDRYNALDVELRALRTSLAETKAERDELEEELRQERQQGGDTLRLDQQRLNLRTAKTKLDTEVRKLREENNTLAEERDEVEQMLQSETEKAAAEEERLNKEILQLHAKLRQHSDSQELAAAQRSIRELTRRIEAYETEQATTQIQNHGGEGNSELSSLQHDLSAARKKEIELLQREASHKESIKTLKRQIADLERKAHEAALDRLVMSPSSHGGSAQKAEVSELRHQLTLAHQSIHDLKKALREAENKAAAGARELQARLDELEEQKLSLEQDLDDAEIAAEEAAFKHEEALKKYKQKAEKYKRERDDLAAAAHEQQQGNTNHSEMSLEERRDLHKMLRESQLATDKLDRQVREQREALEELMTLEMALRKKLDRARSERAAYRASAERLQRDVKALKTEKDKAVAEASAAVAAAEEERALANSQKELVKTRLSNGVDTDAIIRAAEAAERRHEKEIRGLVMQLEWLKACWDREIKLRNDAAFAKRYLLLEVQMRDACNKADLAIINRIRAQLNSSGRSAIGQLSQVVRSQKLLGNGANSTAQQQQQQNGEQQQQEKPIAKLRRVLRGVRFMVRIQIEARNFAKHDKVRQRLADCIEGMEREERIKKMRDQWRAEHQGQRRSSSHSNGNNDHQIQQEGAVEKKNLKKVLVSRGILKASSAYGPENGRRSLDFHLGDVDTTTT
ncbi:myosin-7 [Rhypophila decipiens]|uniref:Myosin-7 n=1 Tax=Rhypophila decipiens TaxID=261697 RepID=A0AAN6YGS5_9PEZI|nr:myosin-7 [Rhypophila decipiens]